MSELHIPTQVAEAMRALRPELRKKLSLRDIDEMTRPFRTRIAELENVNIQLTEYGVDADKRIAELEAALREIAYYGMTVPAEIATDSYLAMHHKRSAYDMIGIAARALEDKT